MPQQACIFCERATPLVTITKEPLFSRWVDQVLTPEMLGPDRSFERITAGPDGVTISKTWPTEVIALSKRPSSAAAARTAATEAGCAISTARSGTCMSP